MLRSLTVVFLSVFVALGAAPARAEPVADARKALDKGDAEAAVLALADTKALKGHVPEAIELLVEAGTAARLKKDDPLAGLACQMALQLKKDEPRALRLCFDVAVAAKHSDDVDRYGAALSKISPDDAGIALERARVAFADRDFAMVKKLLAGKAEDPRIAADAKALLEKADQELAAEAVALESLKAQEKQLDKAVEEAKKLDDQNQKAVPGKQVVLYGTSWCGYCRQARQYFKSRGIPFLDKDIERDKKAALELRDKCRSVGIMPSGVPVIDVNGTLIQGFNQPEIEEALQ